MQKNINSIIFKLSDIAHKAHGSPDNIFNTFFHLLFIKSIFKLNIDSENWYKSTTSWEEIHNVKIMKTYILDTTIPMLSESLNNHISSYLRNSFRTFQKIEEKELQEIYQIVDEISLEDKSPRERYELIEFLLDSISKTSKGNSVFSERTPKELRDFMTAILNPKSQTELIGDFSCGTGSLLLSAFFNTETEMGIYGPNLHGIDINREMYHISVMHSYIAGLTHDRINIEQKNILKDFEPKKYKFDKIYGNSPFGVRVPQEEVSSYFRIQSRSADILFLEATMESLNKEGKAAAIVSGNVLSASSTGNIEIRKQLLENMHIEAIISLPVKHEHTNIPLVLIVFKNIKNDAPILFMDLNRDIDIRRNKPLVIKRLEEGAILYHDYCDSEYDVNCHKYTDIIDGLYWFVEKDKIRKNDYLLDVSFHRPKVEEETLAIEIVLDAAEEQLLEIFENIKEIKSLIHNIKRIEKNSYKNYKIDDICQIRVGRALPRVEELEEGELPWIQIRDITKSTDFEIKSAEKSISYAFAKVHHLTIVEPGTILISVRGTLGRTAIAGTKICIGPNIMALNITNDMVNPWYLFSWFQKKKSMFETNIQGAIPMISMAMLRNISVPVPSMKDQSVYADFYSAISKVQNIKKLSQNSSLFIEQMFDSLFDKYFQQKD